MRREDVMSPWEKKKTKETRRLEEQVRKTYPQTDAYRFNSASIRVRIIDPRFEGKSDSEREEMVIPLLDSLPKKTREDILRLLTLAPSELQGFTRMTLVNQEFEQPLPSQL
jgi:stress-induced morphogen